MRLKHTLHGFALCVALAHMILSGGQATAAKKNKISKRALQQSVARVPLAKIRAASGHIDRLIARDLAKHKIKPNPPASDEVFLRRIYLDIVGRIPSYEEAKAFLDSSDSAKRSKLIDTLLDSEGYVSHNFNYWADLLRIQTRMRYAPSQPYIDFVKDSLRENKPYDQLVRELITAEGYTWDNGAAGYYLRDTGMPLDNMSNTAQVFLGTRLVCAQCHDHPYDSWTQRQYYQLAAFSYGIETRDRSIEKIQQVRQMRRDGDVDRNVLQAANRILQPLAYRVNETDRSLRLPQDYQYDNGKPRDVIDPSTIFGEKAQVKPGDSRTEVYARWMTSAKNPRFATVIANRLWKRVMGIGLIEPIDDFRDGTDPSNPKLMKFLVDEMVARRFDLKQYQRILYNTDAYQREVTAHEVTKDETYRFPGPVLRRLSAEQLWDSLLTMTIPAVDERKGTVQNYGRYVNGKELVDKDMKEILTLAGQQAKLREAQVKYVDMTRDLQTRMRVARRVNDRDTADKLRQELVEIRKKVYGKAGEMMMMRQRNQAQQNRTDPDPRWRGFRRDIVRASELPSPARPGHFLHQFGQSDRETIENSSTEASVPQILTLLNGPMYYQLLNRNSLLSQKLASASTADEKLDVIFTTILSRSPTKSEKAIALPEVESGSRATSDVIWALLNTRQFMFVQ